MDFSSIAIVFVCLALGGVLKGATGAGAPVLAVPALAMLFGVHFAVVVMMMPNLLTNVWQGWRFRGQRLPSRFLWLFASAGAVGVLAGTVVLATVPQELLSLIVGVAVLAYVGFRFARPGWSVPFAAALRFCVPAGLLAGLMQGASGISAPVSLTFLNAMKLERPVFISTVSLFFTVMTAMQIPALGALGLLSVERLALSTVAVLPILAFMPVGEWLAKRFSREVFDRTILSLLTVLAIKLIFDALT